MDKWGYVILALYAIALLVAVGFQLTDWSESR